MDNMQITPNSMAEQFVRLYGREPEYIWRAPGRVNLIGDHTDYQGGLALPIALPYATWVASRTRSDQDIHVATDYHQEQLVLPYAKRRALMASATTLSGLTGFLSATWEITQCEVGADLWIATDVPVASGLSSSAALSLALLATAYSLNHQDFEPMAIIRQAQEVENVYLGVSSGILDPMAIVLAREYSAILVNAARETGTPVPFDYASAQQRLWIVDTHTPRTLAGSGYQQRVHETNQARNQLGVAFLSDASWEQVQTLKDPILRARSRHVIRENQRVQDVIAAAAAGEWQRVKALFWQSHASLSQDFGVSTPVLDATVTWLQEREIGARVTGAGFGGSVIALGEAQREDEVRALLTHRYQASGWALPSVMAVPHPTGGLAQVGAL
ncbi:hypothetical protein BXT84_03270 [Sulfobacillus thermotolerans]|uniref:Galactokinase n=1 Tax=Sulfobacillus thermotolerans TaxID=338644 RepID=A0ABM6RP08_9FIRM|nr:hypothetical protein BXT84_03270 [Sulfobacillus thermotolerans]